MPDDSTDVFKRNMLNRYVDRPNCTYLNRRYSILDKFCLVLRKTEDEENDNQPEILQEHVLEDNHNLCNYA